MRYCFLMQVRPELLGEYKKEHEAVWPEMLAALAEAGWRNYSIFAREDGLLVGYVESDDFEAAQAAMAATEVNARWQDHMKHFFVQVEGQVPTAGLRVLDEVFNLESQLGRSD